MAELVASAQESIGSDTRAAREKVVSLDGAPEPGTPVLQPARRTSQIAFGTLIGAIQT